MRVVDFCVLTLCGTSLLYATVPAPALNTPESSVPKMEAIAPVKKNIEPENHPAHVWNLSNVNIRSVIAEVSRATGKNFLIDPRVQGTVSIVSGNALSNKELYPVFLSMLQVAGYAAVPSGHVIKIIPIMDSPC